MNDDLPGKYLVENTLFDLNVSIWRIINGDAHINKMSDTH